MKKLLTLLFMFFALTGVQAQETSTDENKCGDNLYWSYDGATGTLTISGDGEMYDRTSPWKEYRIKAIKFIGSPTSIGERAFQDSDIESVVIPSSVTSIKFSAFFGCNNLTSVVISEGVTSIAAMAFAHCDNLKSVKIPSTITSLEGNEFRSCSSLVNVELSEGLTSIGQSTFYECFSLDSINIPSTVTNISDRAFSFCSLRSIEISANVTNIDSGAFQYCTTIASIVVDEKNRVYDSRGNCNALIETATNTLMVGSANTVIPEDITSISELAFNGCSGLKSIKIPASVTSIGKDALRGCSGLISLIVDEGNTVYDSRDNCNALIESATNTLISGCKNTIIPKDITIIANNAFYGCNTLESIVIPEGVKSIGKNAFQDCTSLVSVDIPESVTSIGDQAFYYCSALTNIEIPDSITSLSQFLFDGCSSLKSVRIPTGVTSIGTQAFCNCSSLTTIVIPAGVTSIGHAAFYDCTALTSIVSLIPADKLFAPGSIFSGVNTNSSILYVVSGAKSTYENTNRWNRFKNIKEINGECGDELYWSLNDGTLTIMGNGAMYDYTSSSRAPWYDSRDSIKVIRLLGDVTSIGAETFSGCNDLESIVSFIPADKLVAPGSNAFADIDKSTCHLYVPANTKTKYETTIGWKEFANIFEINGECGNRLYWLFDEATETLTILGNGTMSDNNYTDVPWYSSRDSIKTIKFVGSPTNIGNEAFYSCSALTNIVIPEGVTSIGEYAFRYCYSLESVVIPKTLTSIGISAFSNCTALKSIEIPASVTSIDSYSFYRCRSLTSIVVDEENTVYDSRGNCNAIIETATNKLIAGSGNTKIPEDVTSIGGASFQECTGLTSIEIPASVTSIERNAFYGCGNLTSIIIDEGNSVYDSRGNCNAIIETATNKLIKGCNSTIIPEDVTSIGEGAFYNCVLTNIAIPNSVTNIDLEAFYKCSALTSIDIPEGVTNIGGGAFRGCSSLTSVVIPSTVTSIGNFAFEGCSALTSFVSYIAAEDLFPLGVDALGNIDRAACTLYVPTGAKSVYRTSIDWYDFVNIVEIDGQCGDELYWSFDKETDTLSIYGNGKMYDFESSSPWSSESVATVNFTGSPTSIGNNAFKNCTNLDRIELPASITSIGNSAFQDCKALTSLISHIPADKLFVPGEHAFYGIDKEMCTLYVAPGAKATYASTEQWKEFINIKESDTTAIDDVVTEEQSKKPVYYDLSGRRVENPTRGIYIVNGKKVYLK